VMYTILPAKAAMDCLRIRMVENFDLNDIISIPPAATKFLKVFVLVVDLAGM